MKTELKNKLKNYAKGAAALSLVSNIVDAQAVYTDIIPDYVGKNHLDNYQLDLNNDAIKDYKLNLFKLSYGSSVYKMTYIEPLDTNNMFNGTGSSSFYLPTANNSGVVIDNSLSWTKGNISSASYNLLALKVTSSSGGGVLGDWVGKSDKYLGFKFKIGANYHYGWARLDVSLGVDSFKVKDYAYNATPNTPLTTGLASGVSTNVNNNKARIALNENTLVITYKEATLPENTFYSITDMKGSVIRRERMINKKEQVDVSELNQGVYVVSIESNEYNQHQKVFKK
ncbi:MAG: T9SS type A sorting domain-containing protein [Bacteroidetes bacterium]|nr:T9SS type A sorting domain-containing protein [Bacteroidota bacterium]